MCKGIRYVKWRPWKSRASVNRFRQVSILKINSHLYSNEISQKKAKHFYPFKIKSHHRAHTHTHTHTGFFINKWHLAETVLCCVYAQIQWITKVNAVYKLLRSSNLVPVCTSVRPGLIQIVHLMYSRVHVSGPPSRHTHAQSTELHISSIILLKICGWSLLTW